MSLLESVVLSNSCGNVAHRKRKSYPHSCFHCVNYVTSCYIMLCHAGALELSKGGLELN